MKTLITKSFLFKGTLSPSKSLMNRALIAQSYEAGLKIIGDSSCDDVRFMKQGLKNMFAHEPIDCGQAGTVLRFLALRASRESGVFTLTGSERLFSRPQTELLPILGQLGVDAEFQKNSIKIMTKGWRLIVDGLQIQSNRSSQFASGVILNAWDLKFPLHFHISREIVSEGYLNMTIQLMRKLGMRIEDNGSDFFIPANQSISNKEYVCEIDLSSAFAVAALAIVGGEAEIQNFPQKSLQPDIVFLDILKKMGAMVQVSGSSLFVKKSSKLYSIKTDLRNSPDLFPILAVLCALADAPSEIKGLGHLKYKESSRIKKTSELLNLMGATVESSNNEVRIIPTVLSGESIGVKTFDVDQDHRMVMAATIARQAGFDIRLNDWQAVNKSFPELLKIIDADSVGDSEVANL
jgi:3-phosphoshikimate 1-carboxyvinyltransferase